MHGGQDNQAIGTSQSNLQGMLAAANVGNGSKFCGPTNIQSDNTFNQDATNTNTATNVRLRAARRPGRADASLKAEVGVAADPHPTAGPEFRERHHDHHDHH